MAHGSEDARRQKEARRTYANRCRSQVFGIIKSCDGTSGRSCCRGLDGSPGVNGLCGTMAWKHEASLCFVPPDEIRVESASGKHEVPVAG